MRVRDVLKLSTGQRLEGQKQGWEGVRHKRGLQAIFLLAVLMRLIL